MEKRSKRRGLRSAAGAAHAQIPTNKKRQKEKRKKEKEKEKKRRHQGWNAIPLAPECYTTD
jgi:hypothetical protein